jgi:hypothetical protein
MINCNEGGTICSGGSSNKEEGANIPGGHGGHEVIDEEGAVSSGGSGGNFGEGGNVGGQGGQITCETGSECQSIGGGRFQTK